MQKKIIIVGGGFGGIKTALELANKPGYKITLISNTAHFEYHGALYRSATGRSPREVVIPLQTIFSHAKNVEVILGRVVALDSKQQSVTLESNEVWFYDELVIAMGSVKNFFNIPGLAEHAATAYTISDTMQMRAKLIKLFTGRKKHLKITVVGGGPTGLEIAGELQHFADHLNRHQHRRMAVNVSLLEASPRVLPMLDPKISEKATKRLKKLGIEVFCNTVVKHCDGQSVCANDQLHSCDLIIWTAGSQNVDFFQKYPRIFDLDKRGRVIVDTYLRSKDHHIYVIGDNAASRYGGMAQTAISQAVFLGKHLQNLQKAGFKDRQPVYVIPIGPQWAVVQKPNGSIRSGWYGWHIRRQADLWIMKNFEPYRQAVSTWRQANRYVRLPFSLHP